MAQIKSLKVNGTLYNLATNEFPIFGIGEDIINPTAYTHVLLLDGNETLDNIFTKIFDMFKNIWWIYNYRSTDISSIGNDMISGTIFTISQSSGFTSTDTYSALKKCKYTKLYIFICIYLIQTSFFFLF